MSPGWVGMCILFEIALFLGGVYTGEKFCEARQLSHVEAQDKANNKLAEQANSTLVGEDAQIAKLRSNHIPEAPHDATDCKLPAASVKLVHRGS